jgi:hypothetical protein
VRGRSQPKSSPGQKSKTLLKKYLKLKRAEAMTQVIEYQLSKCEVLSSNTSNATQKEKKIERCNL